MLRRLPDSALRRRFFEGVVDGPIGEQVLAGREDEARGAIESTLADYESAGMAGEVYLVGAGPGDPDLLTFRALRLMQKADVVVYDRLVSNAVLDLTRRDAERIYAGKQPGYHAIPQHEINDLLAKLALAGKRVLRLKGGDPFIFGRGGEEIETLAALGIPFQVVPGITAASGCAAYAGIPLTHRDHAQSCIFVTGRRKIEEDTLDWDSLVRPNQTVVIYMGLAGLETICDGLLRHGLAPETPAALIEQGTTAAQVVHTGTVGTLASNIVGKGVRAPTLAIVGDVVRLRGQAGLVSPPSQPGIRVHLPDHRLRNASAASALKDSLLDRDHRRLDPRPHFELPQNRAHVQLDRAVGDAEVASDLLVALSFREMTENLELARRERRESVRAARLQCTSLDDLRENAGHLRRDDRLAADDGGKRVHELVRLHVLEEVAAGPRTQRRDEIALVAARGQHHHRRSHSEPREPFQHGQAVELGHAQIEENDVRLELDREPAPLLAVADRRAHLDAPPLQKLAQAASEQRVVVDDHHAGPVRVSGHGPRQPPRHRPSERPG